MFRDSFSASVQDDVLQKIESENPGNENKQKRALFKSWLEHDAGATWSSLLAALAQVDQSLSDNVRETYGFGGRRYGVSAPMYMYMYISSHF